MQENCEIPMQFNGFDEPSNSFAQFSNLELGIDIIWVTLGAILQRK